MASREQQRIIALQSQLTIARCALTAIAGGAGREEQRADAALDEMNKIAWASKPDLVQDARRSR